MLARLMFVMSLCLLVAFATVAMMHYRFFPYRLIDDSLNGLDAFWDVLSADQINYMFADEDGEPRPSVPLGGGDAGDGELIITTGGAGTLISECPEFGCLAWIMNRRGEVLHTWEADQGALWADSPHEGVKDHNKVAPSGLHLYDNGDLLLSFGTRAMFPYGVGMAKFDRDGRLLWKRVNYAHHWFSVAPNGHIFTPAHQIASSPLQLGDTKKDLRCNKGEIYSDVILELDPEGNTRDTIVLLDVLADNGLVGLVSMGRNPCDPLHLNYVEYVTEDLAARIPQLAAGDLIVSLRHLNMLAAIDPRTREIKWRQVGRTIEQHSPRLLSDGGLIVFDNYGGEAERGGTRIARVELGSDALSVVYPPQDAAPGTDFFSHFAGVIDLHPDERRALVSVTEQGRILEIDLQSGRVLWEYVNNHDLGPYAHQIGDKEGQASRMWTNGAWYIGRPGFLRQG